MVREQKEHRNTAKVFILRLASGMYADSGHRPGGSVGERLFEESGHLLARRD
jgi:hypothetical protein